MITRPRLSVLPSLWALLLAVAAGSAVSAAVAAPLGAQPPVSASAGSPRSVLPPQLSIQSPAQGAIVTGVAIIRFQAENVRITSLFVPVAQGRHSLPAAHLHVTVDDASWHWVHSTSDPVVVTPLTPGEHTITLELAGADHRPLDTRSVRFTVAKPVTAGGHSGHR